MYSFAEFFPRIIFNFSPFLAHDAIYTLKEALPIGRLDTWLFHLFNTQRSKRYLKSEFGELLLKNRTSSPALKLIKNYGLILKKTEWKSTFSRINDN